ncbi:uncharacterized protein GGS22DRAFT_199850 [Annulohypoxylon maeteangense]|uniref:uncharacterized protein n=1 Tax=Annulohypoxylon maeteangense TaxID=1927788 RepID=UPI002008AFC4|nr:uncharacterized protein GGS22DRAFT_199850 [Annulohypoxylon maeteangense]KAI0885633.1 hypothetical protein GGS22DRAFT_199850 [Annulohypoxylon maeteangense]
MWTSKKLVVIPQRTSGLQRLPYEIIAYIVKYLDIDDVFHLSLCSRHFQYLVREERFCKTLINIKASYTIEADEARRSGQFARALRRVAKRRQALSQASPYVIGIVGLADSYEYIHGVLCYIIEARPQRWLRILDLHGSASHEMVVDIPALIREAVPRSAKSRKYKFRVLYHSNGITSCLFSFALPNTENWLLIFQAEEKKIVAQIPLESTAKIFVRNNKDFLYFGTHSEEGADGFKYWVLTGFRIEDRSLFPRKMRLTSVVGYDIGTTVCFEIIDNYFYVLSNQTNFELRETDWISYYHCLRFPLDDPDRNRAQVMHKDDSWRRKHAEGPIDDRWGFLKLDKDEASGVINIIESRKEWLTGKSGSRRTYYMTEVCFNENLELADEDNHPAVIPPVIMVGGRSIRPIRVGNNAVDSDVPVRQPENVHPGDDSSTTPMFTRTQTHLRSYQRCSNTYLDLVDDTSSGSTGRHLRLRTGHRKPKPKPESTPNALPTLEVSPVSDEKIDLDDIIKQCYHPNEIYFWPPERHQNQELLNKVYEILNPPGYLGSITAFSDERSIVYATGEDVNGLKVLIYVSFDPAARLAGMLREGYILGEKISAQYDEMTGQKGYGSGAEAGGSTKHVKDIMAEDEGKGKVETIGDQSRGALPSYIANPPAPEAVSEDCKSWSWLEKAMHQDLTGKLFTFAH